METFAMEKDIFSDVRAGKLDRVQEFVKTYKPSKNFYEDVLMMSVECGHLHLVKYFISLGADLRTHDDHALMWAASYGHMDIVKYLVGEGSNFRNRNDTALLWSAENGHLDLVKYFLSLGCDPVSKDGYALETSIQNYHMDVIKFLTENTDCVKWVENDRVLHWIDNRNNNVEMLKYFVSVGCDLRTYEEKLLYFSVRHNCFDVVKFLIAFGCNFRNKYCDFESPLNLALRLGHIRMFSLFLSIMPKKEKFTYAKNSTKLFNAVLGFGFLVKKVLHKNIFLKKILRPPSQCVQLMFV
jgi:hypothetical protein